MNEGSIKVLIIDDDENISRLVVLYLKKEGFETECCFTGTEAEAKFEAFRPDLILLDIMLPGMDGWQVLGQIRKKSDVPIIMLTAKGETFDKVLGLELGADDYIVKPFEPKELIARIRALIRRSGHQNPAGDKNGKVLNFESLCINTENFTVTYRDQVCDIPPKELELLYFLASHANQVFTRDQLLEQVWDYDYDGGTRTVDVHVKRLRARFPSDDLNWQIKTVWKIGYMFEVRT